MARKKKIEGKAIARILDTKTQEIVGYLFEWNTGDIEYPSDRSEEHTSELQSPVPISYAVFCLKKKKLTLIYQL